MTLKKLINTVAAAMAMVVGGSAHSQNTTTPGGHGCYLVENLEATQTSNPNAGIRKSSRNLIMVKPDDGKAAASLVATASGAKKPNLPIWQGGNGLKAVDGNLTATWEANSSDVVTASGACNNSDSSADVEISVIDPITQTISFTKETTGVKEFEEKITEWLTRFGKKPTWSIGGGLEGQGRRCDFHDDGERAGYKAHIKGSLNVKAPQMKGETPGFPVMGGLVFVNGEATFNPFTVESSVSFNYNEENEDPWEDPVKGSLKIGAGGSVGLKASAGNEKIAEVYAKGNVAITLTGTGNFDSLDRNIRLASATAKFGEITTNASVGAKAFGGEWEWWSGSLTLWPGADYEVPGLPKTIYTIPE